MISIIYLGMGMLAFVVGNMRVAAFKRTSDDALKYFGYAFISISLYLLALGLAGLASSNTRLLNFILYGHEPLFL